MAFARAVVLTGGPTHDFPATTGCLSTLLGEEGLVAEPYEDVDDGLRALPGAPLLVVNALRWTMRSPGTPERYRVRADDEGVSPAWVGLRFAKSEHRERNLRVEIAPP